MNFFDENERLVCDEGDYQQFVHEGHFNIPVLFKKQSPYKNVKKYLDRYDQPLSLANSYLFDHVHLEANRNEIKFILMEMM